jgi:DNA helicase-2/ATP-dependent DNA helicase PcrA
LTAPSVAKVFADYRGAGHVTAPAGFGKTHLIAEAVSYGATPVLVLTHTFAGVNALRRKMSELRVPGGTFQLETIASWSLKLCLSFSKTAGWTVERPASDQWSKLYSACAHLVAQPFIRTILRASYSNIYVDEYQDCSTAQHALIVALSNVVPCKVVGDALQGIFDFSDDAAVDWDADVTPAFPRVGQLSVAHRWNRAGAPRLADWIAQVRARLEVGAVIDLTRGLPPEVTLELARDADALMRYQITKCKTFDCASGETVVAIHKGDPTHKRRCQKLAQSTGGRFSAIDEVEGRDLFAAVKRRGRCENANERLKAIVELAADCMTGISTALPEQTRRGEFARVRLNTRNPELTEKANACLAADDREVAATIEFLSAIRTTTGVKLYRGDLFHRMMGVLRKQLASPSMSVDEAAESYQAEFRHLGRMMGRRVVGTTLLVKGLEFDHAIVLDAASLRRRDFYVAITRGAKSLTILSTASRINPPD